jgi:tetratricopeptide repeat protein 30
MVAYGQAHRLPEGKATETVYGLIRDGKHDVCVEMLTAELADAPTSRPALSILGHCHYHLGEFDLAAQMYERLSRLRPEDASVKLYHAQSLFKAGARADAARAAKSVDDPNLETQVARLLAHIAFEEDEVAECRAYLAKCPADDPDVLVDGACCDLKDGRHDAARAGFENARVAGGYQPDVAYNEALCAYRARRYGPCLKHLAEIIERGVREHPELLVGAVTEGEDAPSVGNTPALRATFLVEAFNLKAAVEFAMKNHDEAREALTDMPPRAEEELDPVTLHNVALMHMDTDPADGFDKLNFLVSSPDSVPAPPECFANLLLLYVSPAHGFYDLAADVLAEHPVLARKHLSADAHEYLDAVIAGTRAPEEAFRRLERAANAKAEEMRGLAKSIQDARLRRDAERVKGLAARYDDALEAYVPFLMAQAKIYWDRAHYAQVEKIFRRSAEFCSEHETFRLNVAHTYFMRSLRSDDKFGEAIEYYEPIVRAKVESGDVLSVTAIVLANLCVAYIMTSRNEDAESLMRRVEKEESAQARRDPARPRFHLTIINLVIGTLYCAKGNYEFGISRVIKSLEPYEEKLEADTWFYAKRCFLSLLEGTAKRLVAAKDETVRESFAFLAAAERHGRAIAATEETEGERARTVASEARALRHMLIKLRDV